MTKVYDFFKKICKPTIIIGLLVVAFLNLVIGSVNSPGNFMPFVANGFNVLFYACLFALPAVFLLLKKDEVAKLFLIILLSFLLINLTMNYIQTGSFIRSGYGATVILYGIFAFLEGLLLLSCIVFFILVKAFNLKLEKVLNLLIIISTLFFFLVFIMELVMYIVEGAGWTAYIDLIENTLMLPFIMVSICVYLDGSSE